VVEFFGSVFWTGLQDFSGLTGFGFNHDNPEKSCHPVKKKAWFLLPTEHTEYTEDGFISVCSVCSVGYFIGSFLFNHGFHGLSRIRKRLVVWLVLSVSIRVIRG
jgi:hypothetical protein